MHGMTTINVELTSRCNKQCWMCGRRKLEKEDPYYAAKQGDMDYRLVMKIAKQIPPGTVVQLHWNGEPTLYPCLGDVIKLFRSHGAYVCLNTNGLLMHSKRLELINLHSITVSLIEADSWDMKNPQKYQLKRFFRDTLFEDRPIVILRALGAVDPDFERFSYHGKTIWAPRVLHAPEMSRAYKTPPTIPEIGVCLDLLHHPAIDRHGDVYPCVRMNPDGLNKLGNVGEKPLADILGGVEREGLIKMHWAGKRCNVPLCKDCHYYGVPIGR